MKRPENLNQSKKPRVLRDHRQVGKRFIPPMLDLLQPMQEVEWLSFILPELLWLGILNEQFGLAKGAELGLVLARTTNDVTKLEPRPWFAVTSAYEMITELQKEEIRNELKLLGKLEPLREALRSLYSLYPACPLSFLKSDDVASGNNNGPAETARIRPLLLRLIIRRDTPGTLMQANAIYIAFVTDLLKVVPHVALANLPAVTEYPSTEESVRVAASIWATVTGFCGTYYPAQKSDWSTYFWRTGLKLARCHQ